MNVEINNNSNYYSISLRFLRIVIDCNWFYSTLADLCSYFLRTVIDCKQKHKRGLQWEYFYENDGGFNTGDRTLYGGLHQMMMTVTRFI